MGCLGEQEKKLLNLKQKRKQSLGFSEQSKVVLWFHRPYSDNLIKFSFSRSELARNDLLYSCLLNLFSCQTLSVSHVDEQTDRKTDRKSLFEHFPPISLTDQKPRWLSCKFATIARAVRLLFVFNIVNSAHVKKQNFPRANQAGGFNVTLT